MEQISEELWFQMCRVIKNQTLYMSSLYYTSMLMIINSHYNLFFVLLEWTLHHSVMNKFYTLVLFILVLLNTNIVIP